MDHAYFLGNCSRVTATERGDKSTGIQVMTSEQVSTWTNIDSELCGSTLTDV